MRRLLLAAVVAVLAGCSGQQSGPAAPTSKGDEYAALRAQAKLAPCPTAGRTATDATAGLPDLTLPCLGGGPDVRLAALAGTPTVVNVWAVWCGPCREELLSFQRLAERAGTRLRVLGVDSEEGSMRAPLSFVADRGVHFPSLYDQNGALRRHYATNGLPLTLFVRADGTVVADDIHRGPIGYDDLTAKIHQHLGVVVDG